jgi:hypothetical protein
VVHAGGRKTAVMGSRLQHFDSSNWSPNGLQRFSVTCLAQFSVTCLAQFIAHNNWTFCSCFVAPQINTRRRSGMRDLCLWTNFPAHNVAEASWCGLQILLCITRHDGRIAGDERNRRWYSDGFEIGCRNGERVRVAFALDCCDREAMSFLATTSGVSGEDVRDLLLAAVEHRFGVVNRLPVTIKWLSEMAAVTSPARHDRWRSAGHRVVTGRRRAWCERGC